MLRKFVLGISNLDVQTGALVDSLVYDAHQERVTGMPCIHSDGMHSATITQHPWVCMHPAAQVLAWYTVGVCCCLTVHPWLPLP